MSQARSMAAGILLAAFVIELVAPPETETLRLLGVVLAAILLLTIPEAAEWWRKRKE